MQPTRKVGKRKPDLSVALQLPIMSFHNLLTVLSQVLP